jgi:hypothetical protein
VVLIDLEMREEGASTGYLNRECSLGICSLCESAVMAEDKGVELKKTGWGLNSPTAMGETGWDGLEGQIRVWRGCAVLAVSTWAM